MGFCELKRENDKIIRSNGMQWEWLIPLFGGLGIGSVITKVVDNWLSNKKSVESRMYQEKREAYLGLLDVLYLLKVNPTEENKKNLVFGI